MSKLPVKKEFDYERIGSWRRRDPYTIAFVYPRVGKAFCLKGGVKDIEKWLGKSIDCSYVSHNTYFCDRGILQPFSDVPKVRTQIQVNLIGNYEADITEKSRKVSLGEKEICEGLIFPITAYRRDGFRMFVYRLTSGKKYGPREYMFEKSLKRTPRCFPKEFLPFCDDFRKGQEIFSKGEGI